MNRIKIIQGLVFTICIQLVLVQCKKETEFEKLAKEPPILAGIAKEAMAEANSQAAQTKLDENGIAVVSDKDSLAAAPTAFRVNNNDKYSYNLLLNSGTIYKLYTKSVNVVSQVMRDNKASETTTSIENVEFKVLQGQNGYYKMSATFKDSKMIISADGRSITIDPSKPKPSEPMLQPGWMIQKARVGRTIYFEMDDTGNISNVTGFDAILAEVKKQLQTQMKGEELNQFYASIQSQLNGNTFKQQVEQGILKFPKGGVKIGESWTEPNSTKAGKTSFTLTKIENGKAYISINSKIPTKSDKKTQGGITGSFSANASSNGQIILDTKSGWIDTGKLTDKISQTETYSNGQQSETNKMSSTTTTYINQ